MCEKVRVGEKVMSCVEKCIEKCVCECIRCVCKGV